MIEISGHSDDVVEIGELDLERSEATWADEVSPKVPILIGTTTGGVVVTMRYGATWAATIRQVAEGIPIPWKVTVEDAPPAGKPDPRSYSVLVKIDCPLGTPVHSGKKQIAPRAP